MSAAPLWTREFEDYKEAVAWADETLTEADFYRAMAQLPLALRDVLALGPVPYRFDCGVCKAFGVPFYKGGKVDTGDPRWIAFLYHEAPKARMKSQSELHYGPLANECYERGLATYRAAGWTGEAPEANA